MSFNADQSDPLTGGGNGSVSTITTTISTLQALVPPDLQNAKDIADVIFGLNNEKNRKNGNLCLMPTGAQNIYGGSIVTQVQVGAKQF